jgi:hypothetical protein
VNAAPPIEHLLGELQILSVCTCSIVRSIRVAFYSPALLALTVIRLAAAAPQMVQILDCSSAKSRGKSMSNTLCATLQKTDWGFTYRVTCQLPEPLRDETPSVEDLEVVIGKLES